MDGQESLVSVIDRVFPSVASLSQASTLLAEQEARLASLKKIEHDLLTERPRELAALLAIGEERQNRLSQVGSTIEGLRSRIEDGPPSHGGPEVREAMLSLRDNVLELAELNKAIEYLTVLQTVDDLWNVAKAALETDITDAVGPIEALAGHAAAALESRSLHLHDHIQQRIQSLYGVLNDGLIERFNNALDALSWPSVFENGPASVEALGSFRRMFVDLVTLQVARAGAQHEDDELLPLQLMFEPLVLSFNFHFRGDRSTNRVDKPEWMFARVLRLFKDHGPFMRTVVQPLVEDLGYSTRNVFHDYACVLVNSCVVERLKSDLPVLMDDNYLLGHAVTETLAFEATASALYDIPRKFFSCMGLFVKDGPTTSRWLEVERAVVKERVEELVPLSDSSMWAANSSSATEDEWKTPPAALNLVSLLQNLTDRYSSLPEVSHQALFVNELHVRALNDFLNRCEAKVATVSFRKDLSREDIVLLTGILNSMYFVEHALTEWSEDIFFIRLLVFEKTGAADDSLPLSELSAVEGSLFQPIMDDYARVRNSVTDSLIHSLQSTFRAKTNVYMRDRSRWTQQPNQSEEVLSQILPLLSSSFFEGLSVLRDQLSTLSGVMAKNVFFGLWRGLATTIDSLIYDCLICGNKFSLAGARQLEVDMQALILIFNTYKSRAENFFKFIKDSCNVLNRGGAVLKAIHERLTSGPMTYEEARSSIEFLRLGRLTPPEVEALIARRVDLKLSW